MATGVVSVSKPRSMAMCLPPPGAFHRHEPVDCAELAPGCGVVGGDLSSSSVFTIAVTAFGDLEGRAPVLRSGAKPGDILAVSGALDLAARGLALLFERGVVDGIPNSERAAALRGEYPDEVGAQLAPPPPLHKALKT